MALIESELGNALHPAVKRKANRTGKLRSAAKRVTSGSTEVMVKITGFGKGARHVKAHLGYVTRNCKLEMENERGETFSGKEAVKALVKDWEQDFGDSKRRKNQRDTMHLVLSMPESTDSESVRRAVRAFSRATFGANHEYVFVLHTNEPHPHCHVTVKCLGFDGKRLNPRKADLQQWREDFADKLCDQGVDAVATPRQSRGMVRKAEPSVIRHIERGDGMHKPRVSRVRAAKTREAAEELSAEAKGLALQAKPWEEAIKRRQHEIRRAWLAAAAALEQENPRKTFNRMEARNERPDYDRISTAQARAGQRAAAVYQSNLEKSRRPAPPGAVAGLRNLSGVPLVHYRRASEVLLPADAPDRLGHARTADPEMRRPRTGHSGAAGGAERLSSHAGAAGESKALAERIRGFVAAMPAIDTERHQIKRELVRKFTPQAERIHGTIGQSPSKQRGQDAER